MPSCWRTCRESMVVSDWATEGRESPLKSDLVSFSTHDSSLESGEGSQQNLQNPPDNARRFQELCLVSPIPLNTSFIAHIPREHPCVVKSTRERRTDERSEVSFLSRIFRHTTNSTYKVKVCWRRVTGRETPRRPSLRVNGSDTPLRSEKWLCFEPKQSRAVRFPSWKLKMSPPFQTCAFSPRDSLIRAFQCSDCNCYSRDSVRTHFLQFDIFLQLLSYSSIPVFWL